MQVERDTWRRRRSLRRTVVAAASTLIVLGVAGWVVVRSPGWDRVRETYFSLEEARSALPVILEGFVNNIKLFLVAEVLILAVALLVALIRVVPAPGLAPLKILAVLYTDVSRGTPTILVVFLIGFGLPALRLQGVPVDLFTLGVIALTFSYGGYVAEVLRAGIASVHPSQWASGRSLGLSYGQTMRAVVLPQAVRRVIPPLVNDFASLQKDTALIYVIGVVDAMRAAQVEAGRAFNFTPYVVAGGRLHPADRAVRPAHRLPGAAHDSSRPGAGMTLLRAEGLRKHFGDHEVLRGIDLVVTEGEAVCLIGASGSGKSTLLRCLNLLEPVTDGTVWFDGRDISDPRVDADAVRRDIGMVFQSYNLFPHLSVLGNVTLGPRRLRGLSGGPRRRRRAVCSSGSAWRTRWRRTRTRCPAASSSGWRWSRHWRCSRGSCCSTRSPPRWTPSWWVRCSTPSGR
jgi:polar amino acid transport system permease protein